MDVDFFKSLETLTALVADQRQELKDLRVINEENRLTVDRLRYDYAKLKKDYDECERVREEWFKKFEECSNYKEELMVKCGTIENENDELRQEIAALKTDTQVKAVFDKKAIRNLLPFYDAKELMPGHGQVCLCCMTERGCVVSPQDFAVLRYNNNAKYFDYYDADVDNPDHDNGVFDYGDYKVKSWLPISKIIEYLI